MIFIDSNIPMYVRGRAHPLKATAQYLLEQAAVRGEILVTDAEVLQEIVHRYSSIRLADEINPTLKYLLRFVDRVFPVEQEDVLLAADFVTRGSAGSSRDAVHAAIMRRYGIERILSFDKDFDRWPGITRIAEI